MEIQIIALQKDLESHCFVKKMRIEIKSENAMVIMLIALNGTETRDTSSTKSLLWGFKICEKR